MRLSSFDKLFLKCIVALCSSDLDAISSKWAMLVQAFQPPLTLNSCFQFLYTCNRFSDDTAIVAVLSDFASYQSYLSSVVHFSSWCIANFLHLNVSKMKCVLTSFDIELSLVHLSFLVNQWNRSIYSSILVLRVRYKIVLYRACYSRAKEVSAATARSSEVASFQR